MTVNLNQALDEKRKRKKGSQKVPATKQTRKRRKIQGHEQSIRNERKEGPTYCPGIAIGPDGDHNPTDLHEIPDPAIMVDQSSPVNKDDGISMVVFDLETTGFGKR